MEYKGYKGTSEYSAGDGCYHGQIAYISDPIAYEGESLEEVELAFREAVDGYIEHCKEMKREALRERIGERLEARKERNRSKIAPVPPRYDEVFFDGVAALDVG